MNREFLQYKYFRDQQNRDRRMQQSAKQKFERKEGLIQAIESQVLPAIFSISRADGTLGSGFFYHSNWLVSNAHVIPHKDNLLGACIVGITEEKLPLIPEQSYHRPYDNAEKIAPDLVIVNTNIRQNNLCCLSKGFDGNPFWHESYMFYVDPFETYGNQIKFLRKLSNPEKYPLVYEHLDGTEPRLGSSGTPIIEAKVTITHEFPWQFQVQGALYASCSSGWYNSSDLIKFPANNSARLVCAVPVAQEFEQILKIINESEMAERHLQMAWARRVIGDSSKSINQELNKAFYSVKKANQELSAYEFGRCSLDIVLPIELEVLFKRWNVFSCIGLRTDHPKITQYNVLSNHSNHHIIPIDDLMYIWNYFHRLPDDIRNDLTKKANIEAENYGKNCLKSLRASYQDDEYRIKFLSEQSNRKKVIEKIRTDSFRKHMELWISKNYQKFRVLIYSLCAPNHPNRTFFAWSYWNLFKGWSKEYRADDPSSDLRNPDFSEKVKPSSFDSTLWDLLKKKPTGLYYKIQALKHTSKRETNKETELYGSMVKLTSFWKERKSQEKVIHNFCDSDWEKASKKNRHDTYALKKS